MRTLRLARIAAEAEVAPPAPPRQARGVCVRYWHWWRSASWPARLVFCHIALWYWLRHHFEPPQSALILAGSDLVLAVILALLAARSTPSRVELEALAVRQRAMEGATSLARLFRHRDAVASPGDPGSSAAGA